jgi:uncharacterized protein DUF4386
MEDLMSNSRLERFAAAAGLIFVVMGLAYVFLSPSMDPLAPAAEVATVYTKNSAGALLWNFVGTLAFFFFLFFLGALYNVLCQAEGGTGWLSLIAFGSGLGMLAIHSVETLSAYTLAWHVAQQADLAVVQALFDLQNLAVYFWAIPMAAMLTATSIITLKTGVFPKWLGWFGLLVALGWLVDSAGIVTPQQGPLSLIGGLIGIVGTELVWIPATSLLLIRSAKETSSMPLSEIPVS